MESAAPSSAFSSTSYVPFCSRIAGHCACAAACAWTAWVSAGWTWSSSVAIRSRSSWNGRAASSAAACFVATESRSVRTRSTTAVRAVARLARSCSAVRRSAGAAASRES